MTAIAYVVRVEGCDDVTTAIVQLTKAQFNAVDYVADAVTLASKVGCQPIIKIRPATPADLEDDDL